jgi:hypothetical protein
LLCIIMGVASIAFQVIYLGYYIIQIKWDFKWIFVSLLWNCIDVKIAALVMSESLGYYDPYGFDVIGFGIWGGFLYLLAGSFGISTTYTRTKSRYIFHFIDRLSLYNREWFINNLFNKYNFQFDGDYRNVGVCYRRFYRCSYSVRNGGFCWRLLSVLHLTREGIM